jgi:hypothetical protein
MTTAPAVGLGVERPALAPARDGADAGEADQVVGEQVQVDAAGDGGVDGAGPQVDDRLLGGHQRRGAGGVDGEGRPAQVPLLRDHRGDHVEQVAGDGEGAHRRGLAGEVVPQLRPLLLADLDLLAELPLEELQRAHARHRELLELGDAGAHEHAGAGPIPLARSQAGRCRLRAFEAGVLQGPAHHVEQEPLLRIGHLHAARGDAEVERAELADLVVAEVGAAGDVRLVGDPGGGIVEGGVVPARAGHRAERDTAAPDQLPEGERVAGRRKAATEADDGDIHCLPASRAAGVTAVWRSASRREQEAGPGKVSDSLTGPFALRRCAAGGESLEQTL